jgi:hypothetical protein
MANQPLQTPNAAFISSPKRYVILLATEEG